MFEIVRLDVRVPHCGCQVCVSEQLLRHARIDARSKERRSKVMAKVMHEGERNGEPDPSSHRGTLCDLPASARNSAMGPALRSARSSLRFGRADEAARIAKSATNQQP
jgi:hypothetical protein